MFLVTCRPNKDTLLHHWRKTEDAKTAQLMLPFLSDFIVKRFLPFVYFLRQIGKSCRGDFNTRHFFAYLGIKRRQFGLDFLPHGSKNQSLISLSFLPLFTAGGRAIDFPAFRCRVEAIATGSIRQSVKRASFPFVC